MRPIFLKPIIFFTLLFVFCSFNDKNSNFSEPSKSTQEFQGKAMYVSKTTIDLGIWGARMS